MDVDKEGQGPKAPGGKRGGLATLPAPRHIYTVALRVAEAETDPGWSGQRRLDGLGGGENQANNPEN